MSTARPLTTRLKIGSTLTIIAGLFPFSVSSYFFVMFLISSFHPSECWRAASTQTSPYSLNGIKAGQIAACAAAPAGRTVAQVLATDWALAQHMELANIMNTGFCIIMISIFALRKYQKWAWWVILSSYLWVGLNDAFALYAAEQPLFPLVAFIIGITGLVICYPSIFGSQAPPEVRS